MESFKNIEIFSENMNENNANGSFFIGNYKFFYKINSVTDYKKELEGYFVVSKYYNVPKLVYTNQKNNNGILIYEYNENIGENKGLLVDYFSKHNHLDEKYIKILLNYNEIFLKTLLYGKNDNPNVFFKDRIDTRINKYYNQEFLNSISKYNNIIFNGIEINLNMDAIIKAIKEFFWGDVKNTYTVLSQCDPNDLNICEDEMILDYICGGNNPIMAEFATFVWYNIAQCEYLSLKYNKNAFQKHQDIFKMKRNIEIIEDNNIKFNIRKIRREAINQYIEIIIRPILNKCEFNDWYNEFKNYLSMKILGVFNVAKMSEEDKLLSIAYLSLFYNKNFENIDELKIFINEIV